MINSPNESEMMSNIGPFTRFARRSATQNDGGRCARRSGARLARGARRPARARCQARRRALVPCRMTQGCSAMVFLETFCGVLRVVKSCDGRFLLSNCVW